MLANRNKTANTGTNTDDVVKTGYLKKLKTMKRKFFVLRRETGPNNPARLEYYDNERKYRSGALPKKPIILRNCFSINRKKDPKHNHVLALYTSHDSVSVAADSEAELNDWLGFLHHHMHQAVAGQDGQARKMYEHIWMVVVQPRSLGSSKNLTGEHHICLTHKSLALVRVGDCQKKIEFPLSSIRRCGHTGSFFFLGLGRSAVTGAGDIWMLTEDAVIAENMHSIIRKALHDPCNSVEDPVSRERTQSMTNHRSGGDAAVSGSKTCLMRERCGSMPSRSRTSSEGSAIQNNPNKLPGHHNCTHHNVDGPLSCTSTSASLCLHVTRPQSMYNSSSHSSSCSPPFATVLFSPSSSESMESAASGDDIDALQPNTPDTLADGLCYEEDSYIPMDVMGGGEGSSSHPQPSFSLPIIKTRAFPSAHGKGLVSPVSVGSSTDGQLFLSSPQDQYMHMVSPSEHAEGSGSLEKSGYLMMDRSNPIPSSSDTCGYLSMAPLNSPGSLHPSWPPHVYSQSSSSSPHSTLNRLDEASDNYLSMVPGGSGGGGGSDSSETGVSRGRDGGYLDMTPTPALPTPIPHSPSDGDSFPEMSPGSSCSFTSGTPSSDHRFPDFIAEKGGPGESYYGCSEDDDSSLDRPTRTNSVGSKPEQYRSRKNRLEVTPTEPARVRAFSVGSRVGLRLGGGRAGSSGGQVAGGGPHAAASAVSAEFSQSIKERGKQVKSKSTSAPILGSSPISNSWSGTPGTFFRGFLQARSQERNDDLMEFDFSKNKSCDSISADKEKKSSSFESIKRTFRQKTSSKSSGNGKSFVFDSMKRDKKKSESELSNKSLELSEMGRYYEINPSPRRKTSESYEGYLPMKPAITTSDYLDMNTRDSINRHVFGSAYLEMRVAGGDRISGSSCSVGSNEGYVDMSEGKGLGPMPISQSGIPSSSNPGSSFPNGAKVRKFSPSSHDDQYMAIEIRNPSDTPTQPYESEKSKKKEKKSIRRRSLKDASRRKKSDPISMIGRSDDTGHEVSKKSTSPLSSISLSTLLGRKTSSSTPPPKTPLSPTGSPLPKSSRGTPSPFSSLTRNKNRDDKDMRKDSVSKDSGMNSSLSSIGTSCIEEASREAEESAMRAISGDASGVTQTSQVPNDLTSTKHTQSSSSKRTSGIFEAPQQTEEDNRTEASQGASSHSNTDHGAYVNLTPGSCEKLIALEKQRKLSNASVNLDYMNISPVGSSKGSDGDGGSERGNHQREYVNMCPGGPADSSHSSSLLTTPRSSTSTRSPSPADSVSSRLSDSGGKGSHAGKDSQSSGNGTPKQKRQSKRLGSQCSGSESVDGGESGYLLMTPGQPSPKPLSPQTVARRPNIPPSLLHSDSTQKEEQPISEPTLTATLERLNLGGNSNERCRSHSGPGAPEGSAVGGENRVKKQLSEPRGGSSTHGGSGRAASACSSPVSYSPPTSPALGGSVSSVSSLSEGGLSSASSTCTVVNMGVPRRDQPGSTRSQEPSDASAHSTVTTNPSSSATSSGDGGLNYVSLDLGPAKTPGVRPSPRLSRKATSSSPSPATTTTTTTTATTATPTSGTQDSAEEEDEEPLSYAQIDFTKSEGLRTTSLSRGDHRH